MDSKWFLIGQDRKNEFVNGLSPKYLAADYLEYKDKFGSQFSLDHLIKLKEIESNAMIAEAINDFPEWLIHETVLAKDELSKIFEV